LRNTADEVLVHVLILKLGQLIILEIWQSLADFDEKLAEI